MPTINANIPRAWKFKNTPDKMQFVLQRVDGSEAFINVPVDSVIGKVLQGHLDAVGYTGPKSGRKYCTECGGPMPNANANDYVHEECLARNQPGNV